MLREKAIESGQYCVKADQGTYIICLEADGTVTKTPIVAWKICAPEITGMSPPRVAEPVTVHFENHETDWVNDCDWAYEFPCGVVSSPNDRDFGSAEIWLSYVKSKKGQMSQDITPN